MVDLLPPDASYKVKKVKPNYASKFEHRGLTFHIHRPVVEGEKLDEGWQVSFEGVEIHTSDKRLKPQAARDFMERCDEAFESDAEFTRSVKECRDDNLAEP